MDDVRVPLVNRRRGTGRGSRAPMRIEEAVAIARNSKLGLLDEDDPDIAKLVDQANALVVRFRLWGQEPVEQRTRGRRLLVVGGITVTAIWLAGWLLPAFGH